MRLTNPEFYAKIEMPKVIEKINKADEDDRLSILRQAIEDGKVPINIDQGKQEKHLIGKPNYEQELAKGVQKSPITVPFEELKELAKMAGTGKLETNKNGNWSESETVNFGRIIGTVDGVETNWGKIHYGKNGIHIVPREEKK